MTEKKYDFTKLNMSENKADVQEGDRKQKTNVKFSNIAVNLTFKVLLWNFKFNS